MIKRWLIIKVFFLDLLRWLHILPDVWYKSELDLAKIRGKEWAEFFKTAWRDCCDCIHESEIGTMSCHECFDDPIRPNWVKSGSGGRGEADHGSDHKET